MYEYCTFYKLLFDFFTDPVSIPICCCETDNKQETCDACRNLVSFDDDPDQCHYDPVSQDF